MKLKEKIEIYRLLNTFLKSEGMIYLEKQPSSENSRKRIKELITNLPNPDDVQIEEHFLVSFAWEILSGHLENFYNLEFNDKPLNLYAKILIDEIDQNNTEVNKKERRYLNEEDINYVRTHYSKYAFYTLKSSRSNTVITQTDTGLELSFLMYENNEPPPIIYPLSKEAHVIFGGDDSKQLNTVTQTVINSINQHYKSNEVQLVIATNNLEKLNNSQVYKYNNQKVITNTETLIETLSDLEKVMLDRFKLFQLQQARDLKTFNHQQKNASNKLPYIVIVIDNIQIDDNKQKESYEDLIMRLTQRSRAAGIHLVILTSDPNRYVPKLYEHYIPNRVAFRLSQPYQSTALLGNDKACYLKQQEYICETYQTKNKMVKRI